MSTLHTNDAPGTVSRLFDLGIEPFLVASSLIGILAQRLVRRTCTFCAVPQEPSTEAIERLAAQTFCPPTDNGGPDEAVKSADTLLQRAHRDPRTAAGKR